MRHAASPPKAFICLILILALTLPLPAYAAEVARIITVFKLEGADIKMTKAAPREFDAKEGQRLSDGYTLSTGEESYAWLKLDEASMAQLDQSSKAAVSKASKDKLSLTLQSGAIFVDAAPQHEGESLEIKVGNSAIAVRGTSFLVECALNGDIIVIMFTGWAELDGVRLEAGHIAIISADSMIVKPIRDLPIDELSPFTRRIMLEHRDEFIALGLFTERDMERAAALSDNSAAYYGLSYDLNGVYGSPPTALSVLENEAFHAASEDVLIMPGGTRLKYWNTDPSGDGMIYLAGKRYHMPSYDLVLYAIWEDIGASSPYLDPAPGYVRPQSYALTYDANGGIGVVPYGGLLPPGATFTAAYPSSLSHLGNKRFAGWNTRPDGSGISYLPRYEYTMPNGPLTLYAVWR